MWERKPSNRRDDRRSGDRDRDKCQRYKSDEASKWQNCGTASRSRRSPQIAIRRFLPGLIVGNTRSIRKANDVATRNLSEGQHQGVRLQLGAKIMERLGGPDP